MVLIGRLDNCISGLRFMVIDLIFLDFLFVFLSFPIIHVNINVCVRVLSGSV